jgi:ribonuclease-3
VEPVVLLPRPISEFEQNHGPVFKNKALLQQAFIHRSYVNERTATAQPDDLLLDNERLEFLGDSILGFVASEFLYQQYPHYQEGNLTQIRTRLVRRETLARLAKTMHLGDYLFLGIGEEESGGRHRTPTLCATFEALVGALYLDQDIEAVYDFLEPLLRRELGHTPDLDKDPKSRLQEWAQLALKATPRYKQLNSAGPDHAKVFVMQVSILHVPQGIGQGHSKQDATQLAAAMALHRYGQPAPEYLPDEELERLYGFHDQADGPTD